MIKNKLSFEKQFDERLYQAMIPHEGNWDEAVLFAQELLKYCLKQKEDVLKMLEEKKQAEESSQPVVEEFKAE